MRQLTLAAVLLTLVANSFQIERLEDVLVYAVEPSNKIQKREVTDTTKKKSFNQFKEFVEDKLVQHTQALEHLVKLVQINEETSRQLLENLSNNIEQPKLPEKMEVISRRSFSSKTLTPDDPNKKISPWCGVALLCHRTYSPVCGYDDNFGYGKFDDVCHMLQVNCYWRYNFALVPSCRPIM
ncbi:PREDICTED: uncharacterized protein LOC106116644 [Papilio xuthus]|uniref:Uncharacterized protein LOC106116644 n=1 Tax=Papilio xuthus TaxID=66420 RepID=A0AAJ6Z625_PAPXU|nr:PREDICTED: uncharacterized protein LOC106116644 [Papilio xuthus]